MSDSRSDALNSLALLVLRVGSGGMILVGHGWHKLMNFHAVAESFPDVLGVGSSLSLGLTTAAEVFCAILLVLGLATRMAALPLVVTMGVAGLWIHADAPWFQGLPPVAAKELALLYLVPFLALLCAGGGRYSLDNILLRRRGG